MNVKLLANPISRLRKAVSAENNNNKKKNLYRLAFASRTNEIFVWVYYKHKVIQIKEHLL